MIVLATFCDIEYHISPGIKNRGTVRSEILADGEMHAINASIQHLPLRAEVGDPPVAIGPTATDLLPVAIELLE